MSETLKQNRYKSFETGITASTTHAQGNGPLTASMNHISTVVHNDDTVTLPATSEGDEVSIINSGASQLQIFPASGDDLGNGVDASLSLAAGTQKSFFGIDDTHWVNY